MAALISEHPLGSLKLIAYMLTIIKTSQQYDGLYWRAYDTNYRLAAAASSNCTWSRLDMDLFTRFFTGRARLVATCVYCNSTGHRSSNYPNAPSSALRVPGKGHERSKMPFGTPPLKHRRNWPLLACADFNAKGACTFGLSCKYRYVCVECGSQHVAKECPSITKPWLAVSPSHQLYGSHSYTHYIWSPNPTAPICYAPSPIL